MVPLPIQWPFNLPDVTWKPYKNLKTNSMRSYLPSKDVVSVCYKNGCIQAKGRYAQMISTAVVAMLLFFGIAALIKAVK